MAGYKLGESLEISLINGTQLTGNYCVSDVYSMYIAVKVSIFDQDF